MVEINERDLSRGCEVNQVMPREIDQIFFLDLHEVQNDPVSERKQFFICLYGGKLHFYDFNGKGLLQRYYTLQD